MKVINEVTKDLEQVAAYLDDVMVFDSDPSAHVKTIRALFERLRKHNLKVSPSKARLDAMNVGLLGHSISPADVRPNAENVSALTLMPMPRDLKQLRTLLGDLSYYRKFLRDMSKRIRPITALLKKGVNFFFTPSMGAIARDIVVELAAPPVLVFPDWDALENGSRPFRVYCDASIDDFGATIEKEQPDGSMRPIAYVGRATLDSERHWTPLDFEAGNIVWAINRLRGYLWGTKFSIFSDHKALSNIGKVGDHSARVQRWLEYLTAFDYTLEYRKDGANGNTEFLSRLPQPATEHNRGGSSRLIPVDDEAIYLVRACGLLTPSTSVPGIGLGGLVPQPDSAVLGGLPLISTEYRDFRARSPRMRNCDLSAPTGRFVAHVSAFVGTDDDRLGRPPLWPAADATFTSVFAEPFGATPATPPEFPPRAPTPPSEASVTLPPSSRISTRTRRRPAAAAGAEQPAVDYGFGPGRVPWRFSSRVYPPQRVPHPQLPLATAPSTSRAPASVPTAPIPTDRDRAEPLAAPLLGLSTPSALPSAPPAEVGALGAAAEIHLGDPAARYSHADL